jgi:hypothetical protein
VSYCVREKGIDAGMLDNLMHGSDMKNYEWAQQFEHTL